MKEIKFAADAAMRAVQSSETAVRRAWSLMEAATEKKRPTEVMSQAAIRRVQGKQTGG